MQSDIWLRRRKYGTELAANDAADFLRNIWYGCRSKSRHNRCYLYETHCHRSFIFPLTILPQSSLRMAKRVDYSLEVSSTSNKNPGPIAEGSKPDHWVDKAGTAFQNPWKSWRPHTFGERLAVRVRINLLVLWLTLHSSCSPLRCLSPRPQRTLLK